MTAFDLVPTNWGEARDLSRWLVFLVAQSAPDAGGIDPTTFLVLITGLGGAVATLAGVLWRNEAAHRKDEEARYAKDLLAKDVIIAAQQARLDRYEDIAPDFIAAVEAIVSTHVVPSSPQPRQRLPSPYVSRRPPVSGRQRRKPT